MRAYESKKNALQVSGYASNGTLKVNASKSNRLARRAAKKQLTPEKYERFISIVKRYNELKENEDNG